MNEPVFVNLNSVISNQRLAGPPESTIDQQYVGHSLMQSLKFELANPLILISSLLHYPSYADSQALTFSRQWRTDGPQTVR